MTAEGSDEVLSVGGGALYHIIRHLDALFSAACSSFWCFVERQRCLSVFDLFPMFH